MNTMKKIMFKSILIPLSIVLLTGCAFNGSVKGGYHSGATSGGDGGVAKDSDFEFATDGESEGEGEGEDTSESQESKIPAGQLTCSALDDNHYYDFWKEITDRGQEEGTFYEFKKQFGDDFNTFNRIKLTITNGNDVYVKLKEENTTFHVDNFHNAYLFASEQKELYDVEISYKDNNGDRVSFETTVKDNDEIDLENTFTLSSNLEIMFVIDATGSMGDEMKYIQAEIDDVIGKVKNDNPSSTISLAMMVYRDIGDDYVTRYSDFTQDITSQQNFLKQQSANGGGDFEEAVDVALTEAVNKQWSSNSTKLLFHVADAPAHDYDVDTWAKAAKEAANKGIKIFTIAASGIDRKTEFFFRSQSLLTAGQYVFLTDDSGIGLPHEEPTIQEKLVVEFLNDCLIRLINGYHQGVMKDPIPYNQTQQ